MLRTKAVLFVLRLGMIFFVVASEKTYFFNLNKTSNEYRIVTRVNANNSFRNYPSGVYPSELRNNVTPNKNATDKVGIHPVLDREWNYNWTNMTRHKLPAYIFKLYEMVSKNPTGTVRILFNAKPQNSTVFRFNLSDIKVSEDYSNVELHFYHKVDKKLAQKSLILRLYQIETDYFNETSVLTPDSHKLLNVIYISQAESGWQVFKLTNNIENWLKERKDLVLFITISRPNQEQFNLFKDGNRDVFRTFIVLTPPNDNTMGQVALNNSGTTSCRKYDLYVDFAKLNWMNFIVSPAGYNAYNCFGSCHKTDKIPNHTRVANFYPEISRKTLCCVATHFTPLTIMFYDKNGNIAIKIYDQMIISACGCR